jgi:formylglycine-generating enzyme required for sulfatase activity
MFSIESWQAELQGKLREWQPRWRESGVSSLYFFIAATALWPVVVAFRQGDLAAVMLLGQMLPNVGSNLLANVIQRFQNEADVPHELAAALAEIPALQQELDELLIRLRVLPLIQAGLDPDDQLGFVAAFRDELARLGNWPRFQAEIEGSGAIAQGEHSTAAGSRAVLVSGPMSAPLTTGDHSPITYVAQQILSAGPADNTIEQTRRRYLEVLYQRCNALPLAALGGEEGTGQDAGLDQVYIALDTRSRIKVNGEEQKGRQPAIGNGEQGRTLSVLEAATQQRRLALLGDPGSGKSSFVRYLAAWLAGAQLGHLPLPPGWPATLPLFMTLRDLAPRLASLQLDDLSEERQQELLRNAVLAQWDADLADMGAAGMSAQVSEVLLQGGVLLIFDGLDEVAESVRARVSLAVKAVLSQYRQVHRVIVTSRTRSYSGETVLTGFGTEILAPFDESKIKQFVLQWYKGHQSLTKSETTARIRNLQEAALTPALRELAANPMLLTTMAIIHQREVQLPRERVRLYAQAVQILLDRWQKRKGIAVSDSLKSVLDDQRKLRLILERLAYEAHQLQGQQGPEADLSRRDILALLEEPLYLKHIALAAEFLDYVDQRAGLLVGRGGDEADQRQQTYSFPHRTFQEYLAGCYMVSGRDTERKYWQAVSTSDYWSLAAQLGAEELLYNGKSTPVFLDLAYNLCTVDFPDTVPTWRANVWSGYMATLLNRAEIQRDEKPGGGVAYLNRLLPRLERAMGDSPLRAVERAEAGRILGQLGDTRPEILDIDHMQFCYIPGGPFFMSIDEGQLDEKPLYELNIRYGYWLARYPVSQAQYGAFVADDGCGQSEYWPEEIRTSEWKERYDKKGPPDECRNQPTRFGLPFDLDNHPVVGVGCAEAIAFGRWLTARWRRLGWLSQDWQISLPSEEEWEKAARGGLLVPEVPYIRPAFQLDVEKKDAPLTRNMGSKRYYVWGHTDNEDVFNTEYANVLESGIQSTSALGCFPHGRSPYGCEEMSGNIWELTRSEYEQYTDRKRYDEAPLVKTPMKSVAVRGGSDWSGHSCTCSSRGASYSANTHGFRVILLPVLRS